MVHVNKLNSMISFIAWEWVRCYYVRQSLANCSSRCGVDSCFKISWKNLFSLKYLNKVFFKNSCVCKGIWTLSSNESFFFFFPFIFYNYLFSNFGVHYPTMAKCMIGWQNCHSMKCVGAIANRLPLGPGM